MSWSLSIGPTAQADFAAALESADTSPAFSTLEAEAQAQVAAAHVAVAGLVETFDGGLPVTVSVYGHACQDDPHGSGSSATDHFSINVTEFIPAAVTAAS